MQKTKNVLPIIDDSTGMRHESISTYKHDSPGQSGFEQSVMERSSSAGFPAAARSMDKSSLYTPVGLPKWGLFPMMMFVNYEAKDPWQGWMVSGGPWSMGGRGRLYSM